MDKILDKRRAQLCVDTGYPIPILPHFTFTSFSTFTVYIYVCNMEVFYSSVRSRKKKFDSNRADNSRTEKLDLFIGALRIVQANI